MSSIHLQDAALVLRQSFRRGNVHRENVPRDCVMRGYVQRDCVRHRIADRKKVQPVYWRDVNYRDVKGHWPEPARLMAR